MGETLTDEQIGELKRLISCCVLIRGRLEARPYGGGLHGVWCRDGGFPMLLARTCFAPASEEHADYIAASVNAIPALLSEREQMREQAAKDRATINRLDNLVLEQGKRIHNLRAPLARLVFLEDELKHSDPEAYERAKESAWALAREVLAVENELNAPITDTTPTTRPIEGDGGD